MKIPHGKRDFHGSMGRCRWLRVLSSVFQNQGDGLAEAVTGFLFCPALTVGAGNFRAPGNKPFAIPFKER
jgi:hypothetical protein